MTGKSGKNLKNSVSENMQEMLSNNLLFLLLIPIVSVVGGFILWRGFSLAVNIFFFFWVLLLTGFVILLNNLLTHKKKKWKVRKSSKITFLIFTVLLLIFSVLLLLACLNEPKKGTLIIHNHDNSTRIPDKIFIIRGFPRFLSFLDVKKELKLDQHKERFSTSEFIRCGNWFLIPDPPHMYDPIAESLKISDEIPYKGNYTILFHKRLCNVHFSTIDKDQKPINGAKIKIEPMPYGFDPKDDTPSFMKPEIGTYTVTFRLEEYEDAILPDITFSTDREIKVVGTLKKMKTELQPQPDQKEREIKKNEQLQKQKTGHGEVSGDLSERVKYTNMWRQVKNYLRIKNFDEARNVLKNIILKYPGTKKARRAREFLEQIRTIINKGG